MDMRCNVGCLAKEAHGVQKRFKRQRPVEEDAVAVVEVPLDEVTGLEVHVARLFDELQVHPEQDVERGTCRDMCENLLRHVRLSIWYTYTPRIRQANEKIGVNCHSILQTSKTHTHTHTNVMSEKKIEPPGCDHLKSTERS